MVKGFRDFLMRGNIVDLAVAVVIGSAFAAVVGAFGKALITPLLNAVPGAGTNGLGFSLRNGSAQQEAATYVDLSMLVNAVFVFIITAAIVYFVFVLPMNAIAERRRRGQEPAPTAPAEDILLLTQIRDLLGRRSGGDRPS